MAEEMTPSGHVTLGMIVLGDVIFDGHLILDGKVRGNVTTPDGSSGCASVLPNGCIEGNLRAQTATIGGSIDGSVHVFEQTTILAGARIRGDVRYSAIEVQFGAHVGGRFIREDPVGNVVTLRSIAPDSPSGVVL